MDKLMLLVTVGLLCICLVNADIKRGYTNVLERNVTKWKKVTEQVSVPTYEFIWCNEDTIQCRNISGYTNEIREKIIEDVEIELYCHPGFYASGETCENNCNDVGEVHGLCDDRLLSCCQHNGKCVTINGNEMKCNCSDGWIGEYCTERCPVNRYGPNCELECPFCSNGGTCNHVTGLCDCSPGWKGNTCNEKCDVKTYGKDCDLQCNNCHGECNHITGECECLIGFGGPRCDKTCDDGEKVQCGWFPNCCHNGGTCEATESYSKCDCAPGYQGRFCQERCTNWGKGCHRECLCANGGTCHPETGSCTCSPGWSGENCRLNTTTEPPLSCPVCQNNGLECDRNGSCICPYNHVWNREASKCEHEADPNKSTQITSNADAIPLHFDYITTLDATVQGSQKSPSQGAQILPYQEEESLSNYIALALISVCGVLAVFVVISLVCSLKKKRYEISPRMKSNEPRVNRMHSTDLPLPPSPYSQDNAYLLHTQVRSDEFDQVHQTKEALVDKHPEKDDAIYSTVKNEMVNAALGMGLPPVFEDLHYPDQKIEDIDISQEKAMFPRTPESIGGQNDMESTYDGSISNFSLPRNGSMRWCCHTQIPMTAPGFERQNSVASYEGTIRPFSRSASVISKTESFYEDMTKNSRSSSFCRSIETN